MRKISDIFKVEILDDYYNNSKDFKKEKKIDEIRYISENLGFIDFLRKDYEKYQNFGKTWEEIRFAKKMINTKYFQENYSDFIKKNTHSVDVKISKIDKKHKTIKSIKLTDYIIEHCNFVEKLNNYYELLKSYKDKIAKEGCTKSQLYNINLAVKTTFLNYKLIKSNPEDERLHEICDTWLKMMDLQTNIVKTYYEYSILVTEIEYFMPFNEMEINEINAINQRLCDKYNDIVKKGESYESIL